jgi:uncharacterized protein
MRWTRGSAPTSPDPPRRPFLTARWVNVALLSYPVPDAALAPHLPPGLALDRWQGDAFVSLVAFDFLDTRVGGIAWPGFTDFPEVNLRFYVREGDRRGVVLVGEMVPSRVVAGLAWFFYNEPYRVARLRSATEASVGTLLGGPRAARPRPPAHDRRRGPVSRRAGERDRGGPLLQGAGAGLRDRPPGGACCGTPSTTIHPEATARVDVEFGDLYGAGWAFLTGHASAHVALAEGSPVAVYPDERLPPPRPA